MTELIVVAAANGIYEHDHIEVLLVGAQSTPFILSCMVLTGPYDGDGRYQEIRITKDKAVQVRDWLDKVLSDPTLEDADERQAGLLLMPEVDGPFHRGHGPQHSRTGRKGRVLLRKVLG